MHQGYIKLWRKTRDNPLYNEPRPKTRREAWEDILLEVNYKPGSIMLKNTVLQYEAGESLKSLEEWARLFRWSKSRVRRFFDVLQKMGQIRHANETQTTRLSVCNWLEYQGTPTQEPTQQPTPKRHASGTQTAPVKERKKGKNERRQEKIPPDMSDVQAYIKEMGYPLKPQKWYDHYAARGWKVGKTRMVDWRAAVRTWLPDNWKEQKNKRSVADIPTAEEYEQHFMEVQNGQANLQ